MTDTDQKAHLIRYLRGAREVMVWKLDGLGEYEIRRPFTPTGTNLLGLIKHLASVESGYFGEVFGRPFGEELPWFAEDAEPNADMWATPQESREDITGLYRRVAAHADATIEALPLDAPGKVHWWGPDRQNVILQQILVHMIAETNRHAGHADIIRELIDGDIGHRPGVDNLPPVEKAWWEEYRSRLESAAKEAG